MSALLDVIAPSNEEGTKATILKWCKSVGTSVTKDEPLIELETDKVTVEIPAPATGLLIEIIRQSNQQVTPGDVLGRIRVGTANDSPAAHESATVPRLTGVGAPSAPVRNGNRQLLSPSVRRLLTQHGLQPQEIKGSGRNGRITAQDVIREAETSVSNVAPSTPPSDSSQPPLPAAKASVVRVGTRVPHTPIRKRIAEHMARSLLEAPHVTTLFEADLTRVMTHRQAHVRAFEAQGARLTLTAYFIAACARALTAVPEVNATFHEDGMDLHSDANIGIGTALGNKGLIVPVLNRAQTLNLLGIAQRLTDVVERARTGKIAPEEVRGGTFTISNHGVGGSLLASPIIINQPQVAILGVGKLERRVVVVKIDDVESISIRSMCYLTLSIDHRALDAFQANAFLSHVVATLETWREES